MSMATSILHHVKKRPFLIASGVAGCSLLYMSRRNRKPLVPDGDIWLDMDLSQPLRKTNATVDLSFLTGQANPVSLRDAVDALEMAAGDDRVRGLVGRFSYRSWDGGSFACVQELRNAIDKFRKADDEASDTGPRRRFTLAVADTFGEGVPAVEEYFVASAFENILLQRSGYVGLTGVGGPQLFLGGFLEKYGIKAEIFNREEYKSFAEPIASKCYSGPSREALTTVLEGMLDDVADAVALARGLKGKGEVRAIMQTCPLPAAEALAAKLIDGIMYPHDVNLLVKTFIECDGPMKLPLTAGPDAPSGEVSLDYSDVEDTTQCKRVPLSKYIKNMRDKARKVQDLAEEDKYVAVINVDGGIVRHADDPSSNVSSNKLCELLLGAGQDTKVGAVVLRIDSPGGSAVASDAIAAAIERVRKGGKPVVCSMGDAAASGGYMIASACDKIVAQPTTITGSIGVIMFKLSFARLLNDWGIQVDSLDLTDNQRAFSAWQELSPKQRDVMDQRVGEIYDAFLSRVAHGRNLPLEKVLASAKGRIWTGRQALDRGLVDELGGLNDAIVIAKKAADMPEDALAVSTYPIKPTIKQIVKRFLESGTLDVEACGGVRGVAVALAEFVIGAETVESLRSAMKVLAVLNNVANGGASHELKANEIETL